MSFIYKSFLCIFACLVLLNCNLVASDDIPAYLWNIKGNALHIKPVSALGHNDKILAESLKDIFQQDSSLLVFAVNKLSLEDFSANDKPLSLNNTLYNVESFLDSQHHMLLPSVKDPLNHIHKAHCGVQEIVVDNKVDESIIQSVSSAIQRSCVVILHISDEGVVAKEAELKSVFLPSFENSKKNIVGVFTGVKSSWGSPNNDHHVFRHLLQATASEGNMVNYTCIILYAEKASIQLSKETNNTIDLPFPVNLDGSVCGNGSYSLLQLNFKPSGSLSSVVIKLNFTQSRGSWVTKGKVTISGDSMDVEDVDLASESVGAPIGFSYSCGDLVLRPKNISHEFSIKMARFQVQPEARDAFSESFDCVTWFTIPIWMGIFVALIFIVIINIGVYALFSVHTMDRFDDPKGKTISISATAD